MSIVDGMFENGKSYTLTQITRKFGCEQKRTAEDWLADLEVPGVPGPRGEDVYLGDLINLKIMEHARCLKRKKE